MELSEYLEDREICLKKNVGDHQLAYLHFKIKSTQWG